VVGPPQSEQEAVDYESNALTNILLRFKWWAFPDSNWGPADYESDALTN
jgi:hypothetical protein